MSGKGPFHKALALLIVIALGSQMTLLGELLQGPIGGSEGWYFKTERDSHSLDIYGDEELLMIAGMYGWNGTGSEEYPFIIRDMVFNFDNENRFKLSNINHAVKIENCSFSYSKDFSMDDIRLNIKVRYLEIVDCFFDLSDGGNRISARDLIFLKDSTFKCNKVHSGSGIIDMRHPFSKKLIVDGCSFICTYNYGYQEGLIISDAKNVSITSSLFSGFYNSIQMTGVDNYTVKDCDFRSISYSIEVRFSSGRIYNNRFNRGSGIELQHSSTQNRITNNNFTGTVNGINAYYSEELFIQDNRFKVSGSTISAHFCDDMTIQGNVMEAKNSGEGQGLNIHYSDQARIEGNSISGFQYGIYGQGSLETMITDNMISGCQIGCNLDYGSDNIVARNQLIGGSIGISATSYGGNQYIGNTIKDHLIAGISIGTTYMDEVNTFIGNRMLGAGFQYYDNIIDPSRKVYFTSINNTVNGKPVGFFRDIDMGGACLDEDFGQIILSNVTNISFSGQVIDDTNMGVYIEHSSSIRFVDMEISKISEKGIIGLNTEEVVIENCTFRNIDEIGAGFTYCTNISLLRNQFRDVNIECDVRSCDIIVVQENNYNGSRNGSIYYQSSYINYTSNTHDPSTIRPLELLRCRYLEMDGNRFTKGGICFQSYNSEYYYSRYNITINNTVAGKPILFLADQDMNWSSLQDHSQLFIYNCSNIELLNREYSNISISIDSGYCDNITIANSSFINGYQTMQIFDVKDCAVNNNTIHRSNIGIIGYLVENCSIKGNIIDDIKGNAPYSSGNGLLLTYGVKVSISDNEVSNTHLSGILISNGNEMTIRDNLLFDCSDSGIMISGGIKDSVLERNAIRDNGRYGIEYLPFRGSMDTYSIISNNIIGEHGSGGIFSGGNNVIYGSNHLTGSLFEIMHGQQYDEIFLEHHIEDNNTVNGMPVRYYQLLELEGRSIPDESGQIILNTISKILINGSTFTNPNSPLTLVECSEIRITELDHTGDLDHGIKAAWCDDIRIDNSSITGPDRALFMINSGFLIENTEVVGSETGISFKSNRNMNSGIRISECRISENRIGIEAESLNYYGLDYINAWVMDCNLSENGAGIETSYLYRFDISGNEFYRNDGCAILNYGQLNSIHENSFLFNNGTGKKYERSRPQVMDLYSAHNNSDCWSSGTIGNYWSDLDSPDLDSNGIIDIPYLIRETAYEVVNTFDMYPLVDAINPIPPELIFVNGKEDHIEISWRFPYDPSEIEGFSFYRGADPWNLTKITFIPVIESSQMTYFDHDVEIGTVYHYMLRTVKDGMEGSSSNVLSSVADNDSPAISIIEPEMDLITNEKEVLIRWLAEDDLSYIDRVEVEVSGPGRSEEIVPKGDNITICDMEDGNYIVRIRVYDPVDHMASYTGHILVDTVYPEISGIGTEFHEVNETVFLEWSAHDTSSGIEKVEIFLDGELFNTSYGNHDGIWLEGIDPFILHNVTIKAHDRAGNSGTAYHEFIIDRTAPMIEILAPIEGDILNVSSIDIEWRALQNHTDLAFYEMKVDRGQWLFVGNTATRSIDFSEEGDHNISVRAFDLEGNAYTTMVNFTLDWTAPYVYPIEPSNWDQGIELDSVVSVQFSELMDASTVSIEISGSTGTIQEYAHTYLFIPDRDLDPSTRYIVTVNGWDLAGNKMHEFGYSFMTVDKALIEGRLVNNFWMPLKGVGIFLDGEWIGNTSVNGYFVLELSEGEYVLSFRYEGFHKLELSLDVKWGEDIQKGNLMMLPEEDDVNDGGGDSRIGLFTQIVSISILLLVLMLILLYALRIRHRRSSDWNIEE